MKLPEELLEHSEAIDALRTIGRVRWAIMDAIGKQVREQEGILFEQVEVLILLADSPEEAIRMRDLASLTLRSKSGMTRLVDRIERDGLVQRQTCEADRRAIFVALTDEGRELIERVKPPVVQIMIDRFTSHMSAAEARVITSTLKRIIEANGVELEHGFNIDGLRPILPAASQLLERTR
jgi:DNA-binding MarR family transcriptional regulator